MPLVEFTERGFYVPLANCYIDPPKKVERAIITHGHSDHARRGHGHYTATPQTARIMQYRYQIHECDTYGFGDAFEINGVQFSFHPAGHVPGSAQVRIEYQGEVWVITGDYKRDIDNVCEPFEPVPCDHFVTECTFGMPIYQWKPESVLEEEVRSWWQQNQELGRASLLMGYSLGKAQRLMQMIEDPIGPIYTHPVVDDTNQVLSEGGLKLHDATVIEGPGDYPDISSALVIAPPGALRSAWIKNIGPFVSASASGWNQTKRWTRGNAHRNFVISDHADWPQLIQTVEETGAENIYVMHGFTSIFGGHLRDLGYRAETVKTHYGDISRTEKSDVG